MNKPISKTLAEDITALTATAKFATASKEHKATVEAGLLILNDIGKTIAKYGESFGKTVSYRDTVVTELKGHNWQADYFAVPELKAALILKLTQAVLSADEVAIVNAAVTVLNEEQMADRNRFKSRVNKAYGGIVGLFNQAAKSDPGANTDGRRAPEVKLLDEMQSAHNVVVDPKKLKDFTEEERSALDGALCTFIKVLTDHGVKPSK